MSGSWSEDDCRSYSWMIFPSSFSRDLFRSRSWSRGWRYSVSWSGDECRSGSWFDGLFWTFSWSAGWYEGWSGDM